MPSSDIVLQRQLRGRISLMNHDRWFFVQIRRLNGLHAS